MTDPRETTRRRLLSLCDRLARHAGLPIAAEDRDLLYALRAVVAEDHGHLLDQVAHRVGRPSTD